MNIENHMVIGSPEPAMETCPDCNGNGYEWDTDDDFGAVKARCEGCDGTGEIENTELFEDENGDENEDGDE
jgi:DnaJ-class molecular chaperone